MTTEDPAAALPRLLRELQSLPQSTDRDVAIARVKSQMVTLGVTIAKADDGGGAGARGETPAGRTGPAGSRPGGGPAQGRDRAGFTWADHDPYPAR